MSLGVLLFVIFLVLKLVGVITWSWWLVTLPLWIELAVALVLAITGAGASCLLGSVVRRRSRRF